MCIRYVARCLLLTVREFSKIYFFSIIRGWIVLRSLLDDDDVCILLLETFSKTSSECEDIVTDLLVNTPLLCPVDLSGSKDDRASKKRKRRRTRKAATLSEGNPATAAADHDKAEGAEERNPGNARGSECLSKNKRRKMKKKRHKEKLLSLGLMPRSVAMEFTYRESEEKDEEDEEKNVEEVLDFLQSTRDLYFSDRKFLISIKHFG